MGPSDLPGGPNTNVSSPLANQVHSMTLCAMPVVRGRRANGSGHDAVRARGRRRRLARRGGRPRLRRLLRRVAEAAREGRRGGVRRGRVDARARAVAPVQRRPELVVAVGELARVRRRVGAVAREEVLAEPRLEAARAEHALGRRQRRRRAPQLVDAVGELAAARGGEGALAERVAARPRLVLGGRVRGRRPELVDLGGGRGRGSCVAQGGGEIHKTPGRRTEWAKKQRAPCGQDPDAR